jgi:uncharacterized protein involved in exopolysaccharide biosynthesis
MSALSDGPRAESPTLGSHTSALLDRARARRSDGQKMDTYSMDQRAPITAEKVGDFLEVDFRRLFVWLGRGLLFAFILAILGAAAGGSYAVLTAPQYSVSTDVLINPQNLQVVPTDINAQPGQIDVQVLTAGSKLRVLTSGLVLSRVVDMLNLQNDPEFFDPTPRVSLSGLLSGQTNTPVNGPAGDPKQIALKNLLKHVTATADDKSFVATLTVLSQTTDKAISISQAIISAFQQELAKAGSDDASRAATALKDRLALLRGDVQDADQKVEAYKRAHNLSSSDGRLVVSQTMTQLNSQIVDAQARVIDAQAAYKALLANGARANSADPVASAALVAMRKSVDDLQQQLDSQSSTLGPKHPAIARIEAQLAVAKTQLAAELSRTIATAKANLYNANAALAGLKKQMDRLTGNSFNDGDAQVALRELERDAAAKTAIYENFLSRSKQISESENIDATNVRVISTPLPPTRRSWPPPTALLIVAGAVAGFLLGLMIALGRGIARDMRQPPYNATV